MTMRPFKAVIFDLDGTLVDSKLDFNQLRQQLGWPAGVSILDYLSKLPQSEQIEAEQCISQFEHAGACVATLMPGAEQLLAMLGQHQLPTAILTRNQRQVTEFTLARFGLHFAHVVCREDAPAKPKPDGLLWLCQQWQMSPSEVLFVGDWHYDLHAAQAAIMPFCLCLNPDNQHLRPHADYAIEHLLEILKICGLSYPQ